MYLIILYYSVESCGRGLQRRTNTHGCMRKLCVHLFSITLASSSIFQMAGRWEKLMKLMTDTQVVKQSVKWAAVSLKGEQVTAKRCVRHFCVSSTTTDVHLTNVRTYKVFRIKVRRCVHSVDSACVSVHTCRSSRRCQSAGPPGGRGPC